MTLKQLKEIEQDKPFFESPQVTLERLLKLERVMVAEVRELERLLEGGTQMSIATPPLALEEFLKLPETKPASEFINGEIVQKPMLQGEHSRLQFKLCAVANEVTEPQKIVIAFPELRCTFGGDSVVPAFLVGDKVTLSYREQGFERIARTKNREPECGSPQKYVPHILPNNPACPSE